MHKIDTELLRREVHIDVAGAGGNGCHIINGLARLHLSLLALGHPAGLSVTLWDDDEVTEANVGRQLFAPGDVGQYKSAVLINRINAYYGLKWASAQARLKRQSLKTDFLIGCVDTKAARRDFHQMFQARHPRYWLDLGNDACTGQVILGESVRIQPNPDRLPAVTELFPKQLSGKKEDTTPSCSLAVALERQELFINQSVVTFALNLLWRLFRFGEIDHHGYFINLECGVVSPLPIGPKVWARFGFRPKSCSFVPGNPSFG
jgi:PRTRC genetic system ThiF family protein